jgi:tight adherence protein C
MELSDILVFAAAIAGVFGLSSLLERKPVPATLLRGGSTNRLVRWVARRLRAGERERLANRLWLLQAGFEAPDAPQNYLATRLLLTPSLVLASLAALPFAASDLRFGQTVAIASVAAAVGLLAPLLYVRWRRARRQQAVREGLPDALDLLLICSEAGLGLDTAILKVGEETAAIHPVISGQLLQVSSELRAGRPRVEAFRGFGDRTGIQETASLVSLLVQSDALGISMSATLRAFAEDMRAHRLLRAEELGQKIAVKLTVILATCLLPALLIAIMTPIVNRVLHTTVRLYGE